jgi:hypothetical protein
MLNMLAIAKSVIIIVACAVDAAAEAVGNQTTNIVNSAAALRLEFDKAVKESGIEAEVLSCVASVKRYDTSMDKLGKGLEKALRVKVPSKKSKKADATVN